MQEAVLRMTGKEVEVVYMPWGMSARSEEENTMPFFTSV
jgi:hypothetical protein